MLSAEACERAMLFVLHSQPGLCRFSDNTLKEHLNPVDPSAR